MDPFAHLLGWTLFEHCSHHTPPAADALNWPAERYSGCPGLMGRLEACGNTAQVQVCFMALHWHVLQVFWEQRCITGMCRLSGLPWLAFSDEWCIGVLLRVAVVACIILVSYNATLQALLKQLRDQGTLAALAGNPAAAPQPAAIEAQQPAAAQAPPAAAPAEPAPARTPRHGSGSRGGRELQGLLQSQQQQEAALLHEALYAAAASAGQPDGIAGRKRTRQQRQQAQLPDKSAGLSLLLLRGDSRAAESLLQAAEGSEAGEEGHGAEQEWTPPRRRQRGSGGEAVQRAAEEPATPLAQLHEDQEEEAVAGLIRLASSPAAAAAVTPARRGLWATSGGAAAGGSGPDGAGTEAAVPQQHRDAPALAAERLDWELAAGVRVRVRVHAAGSPEASPTASAGSGRSSSERWGQANEDGGPAGMAVDSSWNPKQAAHGRAVWSGQVQRSASAHERERQRQQRLLSLLGSCIQSALAKQQQEQQQRQQQQQQAGSMGANRPAPTFPSGSGEGQCSCDAGEDDATSAAAMTQPLSPLAAAQALLSLSPTAAALPAMACMAAIAQQHQQQLQQREMQQRLAAAMLLCQQHSTTATPEHQMGQQVQAEQHTGAAQPLPTPPQAQTCTVARPQPPLVQVQVPVQLVSALPSSAQQMFAMRPAVHKPLHQAASMPAQQGSQLTFAHHMPAAARTASTAAARARTAATGAAGAAAEPLALPSAAHHHRALADAQGQGQSWGARDERW